MKFGVNIFPTDYAMPITELAKACEDLGYESLWVPEHTHIPVGSAPPMMGREYSHTLDPFVALTAAAAVTKDLAIGTGICLVIERDPIVLAKEVASLDHISGGRFMFGIGGGWNTAEMQDHGTKPTLRWKILRERILAMKAIWASDEAEYHGQFVDFGPMQSWPKPVQRPHPPILVGGDGPRTLQRVVEYGDGWFPLGGQYNLEGVFMAMPGRLEAIPGRVRELRALADEAGKGPYPVSLFGAPIDQEGLEALAAAGVERAIFWVPPGEADVVMPLVKRGAELAKQLAGGRRLSLAALRRAEGISHAVFRVRSRDPSRGGVL